MLWQAKNNDELMPVTLTQTTVLDLVLVMVLLEPMFVGWISLNWQKWEFLLEGSDGQGASIGLVRILQPWDVWRFGGRDWWAIDSGRRWCHLSE